MINKFAGESSIIDDVNESEVLTGTVKWWSPVKFYGFILPDHQAVDVFVHINSLKKSGLELLKDGQRVKFTLENYKGRVQATNIEVV
jgi:cold shock CspA family protein